MALPLIEDGTIGIAGGGDYGCAVYEPPLNVFDRAQLEVDLPEHQIKHIGFVDVSIDGVPATLQVFRLDQFASERPEMLRAFRSCVFETIASILPERGLKREPVKIGKKAMSLFQRMQKEDDNRYFRNI